MPKAIWISWERHRRTSTLVEHFGLPLHTLVFSGPAFLRYPVLSSRTVALLVHERPDVLVVQNPSIVLATLAVLLRSVLGYRLIVDAHNEAVEPYANSGPFFKRLSAWLLGKADATIVTNAFLAQTVTRHGGHPLVLPDKVPAPAAGSRVPMPNAPDAVLIATFAADEPIEQVVEAFQQMPDVTLAITGRWERHRHRLPDPLPSNIRCTGFLSDDDYWQLIAGTGLVVDLSYKPDCLVCGAYESVAVGTPMVLSDDRAIRQYFHRGTRYAKPEVEDVRRAVREVLADRQAFRGEALALRDELTRTWPVLADQVARELNRPQSARMAAIADTSTR